MRSLSRKFLTNFSIFSLIFLVLNLHPNQQKEKQSELGAILKNCAEYCERLANSVLFFVCQEKIKEEVMYSRVVVTSKTQLTFPRTYRSGSAKNIYVYDYQLFRKGDQIKEQRTLIEHNGEKKHEENAQLQTRFFTHENIIFGPIGLLSSFWQPHHDYKILKKAKFKGDRAVIMEAVPKPESEIEHLYGKIWVRKSDFSILKIEWDQKSIRGFEYVEEIAERLKANPRIVLTAEYGIEKNKIRFLSRFSLDEIYIIKRGRRRFQRSKTEVLYDDYKFFTVKTEVKY